MGLFRRSKDDLNKDERKLRRRLSSMSQRDLLDLAEGHVGQLSICILTMRQRSDQYNEANWSGITICNELAVILDELDQLA